MGKRGLPPEWEKEWEKGGKRGQSPISPALMRDQVHEIVKTLKRNLKVDWTEPHRDDVKASVRSAVKRVLRKRNISAEQIDTVLDAVMAQAEALFAGWPVAA